MRLRISIRGRVRPAGRPQLFLNKEYGNVTMSDVPRSTRFQRVRGQVIGVKGEDGADESES